GLIITLGPGIEFDPRNNFSTNSKLVKDTDYENGHKGDRDCPLSNTQCLIVQLKKPGLPGENHLSFSQGIVLSQHADEEDDDEDKGKKRPVTLSQLAAAGVYVTYL